MEKLSKQQIYKRAYEWQKLKDRIEAKEKAMELQVQETDRLRVVNKRLITQLAEVKSLHESSGLNIADVMPCISHFEDECGNKYNGNYIECTVGIDNQLSFYLDYGNETPTIPVIPKYGA